MPPLHWVAATLTFVMVRLSPSDPAVIRLGGMATPEELAAERERLGLNDPVLVPYGRYMTGILRLDFGPSLIRGGPAMAQVLDRVPNSLLLGASAMVIVIGVSIPLGLLAGRHGGRVPDHLITGGSLVGQALPEFWVGLMLMLVFARQLHWLPSSGMGSLWHLLMPAFTLALPLSSVMVRLVRGGMIGVLREDYIDTARAKGLSERVVLVDHALPNTLIPVVTIGGLQLGYLLGGTAIVETVFAWPGIGNLLVSSIGFRDFPMIQACIVVITGIVVLINLAVDLAYGYLDPRIRIGSGPRCRLPGAACRGRDGRARNGHVDLAVADGRAPLRLMLRPSIVTREGARRRAAGRRRVPPACPPGRTRRPGVGDHRRSGGDRHRPAALPWRGPLEPFSMRWNQLEQQPGRAHRNQTGVLQWDRAALSGRRSPNGDRV